MTIAGQSITGAFAVQSSSGGLLASASDVGLSMGSYITIANAQSTGTHTGASGQLLLNGSGVAAELTIPTGDLTLSVPSLTATTISGSVQINTQSQAVNVTNPVDQSTWSLPTGPYVQVTVTVPAAHLATLNAGPSLSGSIAGSLLFQQQTVSGATKTLIGLAGPVGLAAGARVPPGAATLTNGTGLLVIEPVTTAYPKGGVAGYVSGAVSTSVAGVDAHGNGTIRFNTTGGAVNESVMLDGQQLTVDFGASEGHAFSVSVSGLSLNIDNVVTIEGNVNFTTFTDAEGDAAGWAFTGTGLQVFFGNGPATLQNGDINPLAEGLSS